MTTREVVYLNVWRTEVGLSWQEIEAYAFGALFRTNEYAQKWLFHGSFATVGVVTTDAWVTREMALKAAENTIIGNTIELHFDLKRCIVEQRHGKPHHPR